LIYLRECKALVEKRSEKLKKKRKPSKVTEEKSIPSIHSENFVKMRVEI